MAVSEQDKEFLFQDISKSQFCKKYKQRRNYKKPKTKEIFLFVLSELENAIVEGKIDIFKRFDNVLEYIISVETPETLKLYFNATKNHMKSTNLIILSCKHNRVEILEYIFDNSSILENLTVYVGAEAITPDCEDDFRHNAFYYTLRSNNTQLLDILIEKWPGSYFTSRSEELDEVLSRVYEELKWKNVSLSDSMEVFVETKLINLRFFSNGSKKLQVNINNITKRVDLVLEKIDFLKSEYSKLEKVDETFLFVARFIAQNIHVLKGQLKFTYDRLPWEEMEFCLVTYVFSQLKQREKDLNLFYRVLNKAKILLYLGHFAKKLEGEKHNIIEIANIDSLSELPKLKRDCVVEKIIFNNREFQELYDDYRQIRDIHSLYNMNMYSYLASSCDLKNMESQLIIMRALQVIGEYLKDTLESPKLSNSTSELLLMLLPKNTRKIIIKIRDSLSHLHPLSIEENTDPKFFIGVQKDVTRIYNVTSNILFNNKMKMIQKLLQNIIDVVDLNEFEEVAEVLKNVSFIEETSYGCQSTKFENLEKLVKEMNDAITDKNDFEKQQFARINEMIQFGRNESKKITCDYIERFELLKSFAMFLNGNHPNQSVIEIFKWLAKGALTLQNLPEEPPIYNLRTLAEHSIDIYHSAGSRLHHDKLVRLMRSVNEIFCIAESEISDIKWIEKMKGQLFDKGSFNYNQSKTNNIIENKYEKQLASKLTKLDTIMKNNSLSSNLIKILPSYKSNKKLQAAVEMLVLDIMSILSDSKKQLENNSLFLDGDSPLLTGKCLRNHLAHGNTLLDALLSDPSTAIIVNAEKLTSENIVKSKKKIGKLVENDPIKLQDKFLRCFDTVSNQKKMFAVLEAGNLEELKCCLAEGADISARSINAWSALHFASLGPSLEVVKFVLNQNIDAKVTDIEGQIPLHTAAASGRRNIVKFFITKAHVPSDFRDNNGNTPLHMAAKNGHKDVVEVLLENYPHIDSVNNGDGYTPLQLAVQYNQVEVAKVLLKKSNIDDKGVRGDTLLHIAARFGCMEMVNFLLSCNANVNARQDRGETPLHDAALNGHPNIIETLILKGANVNATALEGTVPLHYSVELDRQKATDILLKMGANVNITRKIDHNTPLHEAARNKCEVIVESLLKYKADPSCVTVEGLTPLHAAAWTGTVKIVISLIKSGADVLAKSIHHTTPLHHAAEAGQKEIAELLIQNDADINSKGTNDVTPLHIAARLGKEDVAAMLITEGAKLYAKDVDGNIPMHSAAEGGKVAICHLLVKNKVNVNVKNNSGYTPLHIAAQHGHKDIVAFLLNNKAEINAKGGLRIKTLQEAFEMVVSPLHLAIKEGHKEVVDVLVEYKADVNSKCECTTPLLAAIKLNQKEIVETLIKNGADIDADSGEPLLTAMRYSRKNVAKILLDNNACTNVKDPENITLLHFAVNMGDEELVSVLINGGAEVDALTINGVTPLHMAAQEGYIQVAEILLSNKANINAICNSGYTPLHVAVTFDHGDFVDFLLVNGAKIDIKDHQQRSPLELAVILGHLPIVKIFLQDKNVDRNAKGSNDYTILHIAAETCNLEMIEYLVNNGCNIKAESSDGFEPVHVAARKGHKDVVDFFLANGVDINNPTAAITLMKYAIVKGQLEIVKFLVSKGVDINLKDEDGCALIFYATVYCHKKIILFLLESGAVFNPTNKKLLKPSHIKSPSQEVASLFKSINALFKAVQRKNVSDVKKCIKCGVFTNAKHADSKNTPLHYAAWKGCHEIINILLENEANPNSFCSRGSTPLHYAVKFSHYNCVVALLQHGAIYNAVTNSGTPPLNCTSDSDITDLLELIDDLFRRVENSDDQVIKDLNQLKDLDVLKAVMNACNKENKTLIAVAPQNDFRFIENLKSVAQGDVFSQINLAMELLNNGNFQKGLHILEPIFEKRKQILGPDNLATLDSRAFVAQGLLCQGNYQYAFSMLDEIFQKQKRMLGFDNKYTLYTRYQMASVLHSLSKSDEALRIFQEVHQRQTELLGSDHLDTENTQFEIASVLITLCRYDEALNLLKSLFITKKTKLGVDHVSTIQTQHHIARVLSEQGKYEESLEMFKEVFEKFKNVLGIAHFETLRTKSNIAALLFRQHKCMESRKMFEEVLDLQRKRLPRNHPDILNTLYCLGNVFFSQNNLIAAVKVLKECYDIRLTVFGPNDTTVIDIAQKIELINNYFEVPSNNTIQLFELLRTEIIIASSKGDVQKVKLLLKGGVDVNEKDIDGRTPLHYAISNGRVDIVNILLGNDADVAHPTNKGNTPLHTATLYNNFEIVEILLKNIRHDKLNDFVNAKTTSSGATSLHIAAKNGCLNIVKLLLKHGAMYDVANKEGKRPVDLSTNQKITDLLTLINDLFKGIEKSDVETINKLKTMKPDEFSAATGAHNTRGHGLLQVAILNEQKNIASLLVEMLKKMNHA